MQGSGVQITQQLYLFHAVARLSGEMEMEEEKKKGLGLG